MVDPASVVAMVGAIAVLTVAQDVEGPAATTRVHDLSAFHALRGTPVLQFDLAPQPWSAAAWGMRVAAPEEAFDFDEIGELLRRICTDPDDEAGLQMTMRDDALVVTASAEVNDRIARTLAWLRSACLGAESLEIRVIAGEGVLEAPLLLDVAEADRRIQELVASGRGSVRRVGSTALRDGLVASLQTVDSERYVCDHEVEIAHGSVIYDPVPATRSDGLEAAVRAGRWRDATWLDLAIRYSEPAAPMRDLTLRPWVWFASPTPHEYPGVPSPDLAHAAAAMFHGELPIGIECPRTRLLSFAGSFLLPDGKSLWIPGRIATKSGSASLALEIRARGPFRPMEQVLPGGPVEGRERAILQIGSFQSHGVSADLADATTFELGPIYGGSSESERESAFVTAWPSWICAQSASRGFLIGLVEDVFRGVPKDKHGFAQILSAGQIFVDAPASVREQIVEKFTSAADLGSPVEVSGRVTRGDATVAEFRVPALTGRPATIWTGIDGSYLADWDVDVADQAFIANPEMREFMDGVALRVVVRPLRGERVQVTVNGMVNLLDGLPQLKELLDPYTPVFEKLDALRLPLNESCNVPLHDGRAVVRLGGDPLALELTIRPQPQPAAAPPSTTRSFDLAALLAPSGATSASLDLCPRVSSGGASEHQESQAGPALEIGEFCNVVEKVVAAGAGGADAKVELQGSRLVVSAPEPLLAHVDRLVGLFEKACLGEERVEVRVVTGEGVFEVPLVLDAVESDRRVAALVASGKGSVRCVGSAALTDGLAAAIGELHAGLHVQDYEVEIAHGSVIYDPVIEVHEPGLTTSIQAARAPDATYLDFAVRDWEPDDAWREQIARPTVWFSSPLPPEDPATHAAPEEGHHATVVDAEIPLLIESLSSRVLGFAGSFVLPNGKSLWIPCRATSQADPTRRVACALEVSVRGPCRPMVEVLAGAAPDEPEAAILHVGSWTSAGFRAEPMDDGSLSIDPYASPRSDDTWWPSSVMNERLPDQGNDVDDPLGIAGLGLPELETDASVIVATLSRDHLFVQAPAPIRRKIEQRLATVAPTGRPIELRGRITRGAETIGEFRIPALTGKLATIWSGLDGSFLADWDVDVAGESMVGNPEIGAFLDGFALRFVVRSASDADLQLETHGVLDFLDGPPAVQEIANPYTPYYEKVKAHRLFVDETRNLTCTDRKAKVRFGDDSLALEVTVELR